MVWIVKRIDLGLRCKENRGWIKQLLELLPDLFHILFLPFSLFYSQTLNEMLKKAGKKKVKDEEWEIEGRQVMKRWEEA